MELALECPTTLLDKIQPLTDFYFALTHLVLSDPAYADYYATHHDKMLILDNSTNELGVPCSIDDILKAAEIIKPDIIVPPDHLCNMEKTIEDVRIFKKVGWEDERFVLPVIQGSTIKECYKCADKYVDMGFKQCAVPYDPTCTKEDTIQKMASQRQRVVVGLTARFEWVHLLGFTVFEELQFYRSLGHGCRFSIDTGSPIMHGLKGIRFGRDPLLDKKKPTMDMMPSKWDSRDLSEVFYNLAFLRKELNGI